MTWFVYLAKARTTRYYTGISTDPLERLEEHNAREGSNFSKEQGPMKLVYYSKPFASKSEARKREAQIKDWTRVKKEKLIRGEWA